MSVTPQVRAAGGVVVRLRAGGERELVAVHRPRYDDWSLPKGKLHAGEDWKAAALREVEEETGLACEIEHELAGVSYWDRRGRLKLVRYWLMRPRDDAPAAFEPNDEVDEIRWLSATEALAQLSYEHDRDLVASLGG